MSIRARRVQPKPEFKFYTIPSYPLDEELPDLKGGPNGCNYGGMKKCTSLFQMALGQATQHLFSNWVRNPDDWNHADWLWTQFQKSAARANSSWAVIEFLGIRPPRITLPYSFSPSPSDLRDQQEALAGQRERFMTEYQASLFRVVGRARGRIQAAISQESTGSDRFHTAWNFAGRIRGELPPSFSYELVAWLPETNLVITYIGRKMAEGLVQKDIGVVREVKLNYRRIKNYNDFKFAVIFELVKLLKKRKLSGQEVHEQNKGYIEDVLTVDDVQAVLAEIGAEMQGTSHNFKGWRDRFYGDFRRYLLESNTVGASTLYRMMGLYILAFSAKYYNINSTIGGLASNLVMETFRRIEVIRSALRLINSNIQHFAVSLMMNIAMFEENSNREWHNSMIRPEATIKTGPVVSQLENFVLAVAKVSKGTEFMGCISNYYSIPGPGGVCIHRLFQMGLKNELPRPQELTIEDVQVAYAILMYLILQNSKLARPQVRKKIEESLTLWARITGLKIIQGKDNITDKNLNLSLGEGLPSNFLKKGGGLNLRSILRYKPNALFLAFNFAVGSLIFARWKEGYELASFHTIPDAFEVFGIDSKDSSTGHGGSVSVLGGTFLGPVLERYLCTLRQCSSNGAEPFNEADRPFAVILQENKLVLDPRQVSEIQDNRIGLLLILYYVYTRGIGQSFEEWIKEDKFWEIIKSGGIKFGSLLLEFIGGVPDMTEFNMLPRGKERDHLLIAAKERLKHWLEHYPPRVVLEWYDYETLKELAEELYDNLREKVERSLRQEGD